MVFNASQNIHASSGMTAACNIKKVLHAYIYRILPAAVLAQVFLVYTTEAA